MQQDPQNPLIGNIGIPQFDKIEPQHVVPAIRATIAEVEKRFAEIEANAESMTPPTWDSLISPIGDIEVFLNGTWGTVRHLNSVRNSPELRDAYEAVQGEVVALELKIGQSKKVYDGLKAIKNSPQWEGMDRAQERIVNDQILAAELSGVGLSGDQQLRFNEIAKELSDLSTKFQNNVLDATKAFSLVIEDRAELDGMPDSFLELAADAYNKSRAAGGDTLGTSATSATDTTGTTDTTAATGDSGPWLLTLDVPSRIPVLKFCSNRALREKLTRVAAERASSGDLDNNIVILRILELRREKASLLGYDNYLDLSIASKMARTGDEIYKLQEELRSASWEPGGAEYEEILEIAKRNGFVEEIQSWDAPYWSRRLEEEKYQFTEEEIKPYLPLPQVLDGLFTLSNRLFGIEVKNADGEAPVWHPDVRFFKIFEAGKHIASFFLDPYSRPENKRGGAWMADCVCRRALPNGDVENPVAYLACNFTPPVGDKPSLLTFRSVITLFHEFGHGLQHMLTKVDYVGASGINGVEWDAVELASQFMENWCYHRPTVIALAKHYKTGEPLPDELFEKVLKSKNFEAGLKMLRQVSFGLIDLELHDRFDPKGTETIYDVESRIQQKTAHLPQFEGNRFLCAFTHIFAGGYAAGYYSYKWAEVLSADAFAAFEEAGIDDDEAVAKTGRRYRNTVLALGGGENPMEVFKMFRGREPSTEPLLRHSGLLPAE